MVAHHRGKDFRIETATEDDWSWMMQGMGESVRESLGPERLHEVGQQAVRERLKQQAARIRGPEGFPNQAFIVRDEDGRRAGFIWVAKTRSEFTGQPQAFVLDVYVAESYRGQGLGRRLMETAEEWARQQGLRRIALSVATHNAPARGLYETLGYQVETLRMSKGL